MKILWVSNSPIGPAATILGLNYAGSSGGWIQSEFEKSNKKEHRFYFLCSDKTLKKKEVIRKETKMGVAYCIHSPTISYGIKCPKYLKQIVKEIVEEIKPDVIHIWGTETFLSNIAANTLYPCPKVVFLQGLLGIHSRYLGGYYNNSAFDNSFLKMSIKDKLIQCFKNKLFKKQVKLEKDTICKCNNVIYDGYLSKSFCESLSNCLNLFEYKLLPSNAFYEKKWDFNKCEEHTVFTIFSGGFEKGLQQLLKAVKIVKESFPDIKVYVPGPFSLNSKNELIPRTYYEKAIKKMILDFKISDNIFFTGKLSREEVASFLTKCNCFVNTSIMENHALSLREALVVGIPSITTVCGNVLDYVSHNDGAYIYRYEEPETLALYIKKVFDEKPLSTKTPSYFSSNNSLEEIYKKCVLIKGE